MYKVTVGYRPELSSTLYENAHMVKPTVFYGWHNLTPRSALSTYSVRRSRSLCAVAVALNWNNHGCVSVYCSWCCWCRVQNDVVCFDIEMVPVTAEKIAEAVCWVQGLSRPSAVNHATVCETLNNALKLASVGIAYKSAIMMMMRMVTMVTSSSLSSSSFL